MLNLALVPSYFYSKYINQYSLENVLASLGVSHFI